jgi:hypothetical protein
MDGNGDGTSPGWPCVSSVGEGSVRRASERRSAPEHALKSGRASEHAWLVFRLHSSERDPVVVPLYPLTRQKMNELVWMLVWMQGP